MTELDTEHAKSASAEESEMDDSDRLLYEMVVRLSALELVLVKNGIVLEADLAEAQVGCMQKIKEVLDVRTQDKQNGSSETGFIKYGEKNENP